MSLKISQKKALEKIAIFVLLLFSGALLYKQNSDAFLLILMVYSIVTIVKRKLVKDGFLKFAGVLFASCLLTSILTHGSLSIGSAINLVMHFVFPFCVIQNHKKISDFIINYCSVTFFVAIVSLPFFAAQLIVPNLLKSITITNLQSGVLFYTNIIYTFSSSALTRNCGIMTEPGLYQIILNTAIFFAIFFPKLFSEKKRILYLIVFTITIITTQSALAYINLCVIVFFFLISRNKENRKTRNVVFSGIVLVSLIILVLGIFNPDIPFVSTITEKLFVDGRIDVSVGSGRYRMISMLTDLEVFKRNIFGAGYTDYYDQFRRFKVENTIITSSSCGLTYCLAVFGVITFLLIILYYFSTFWKAKGWLFPTICFVIIVGFTSWSQPLIYYPPFIAIAWILINKDRLEMEKQIKPIISSVVIPQKVKK